MRQLCILYINSRNPDTERYLMMKSLTYIIIIVATTLLASTGYGEQEPQFIPTESFTEIPWTSTTTQDTVESVWLKNITAKDTRKAQDIFNQEIRSIDNAATPLSIQDVLRLTSAIAKIIPKMPILGMGGMDTKNQGRVKRALFFLENATRGGTPANSTGVVNELKILFTDRSLTKQIKEKLTLLIKQQK